MLSKIYYGLGIVVIALYLLLNLPGWRSSSVPQTHSFGVLRMTKGKYVPSAPSYPSNNPYSTKDDKSDGRYRSYPSGGGYSGGK